MKKIFLLSTLICLAMICSCQKQDSAAQQQQLTEPKTEPSTREEALAERVNSLEEKVNSLDQTVKALAAKENTSTNAWTTRTNVRGQTSDPAQLQAEKKRMLQQLSTLMPDPSQVSKGDPTKHPRPAQQQLGPEDLQRQWQANLDKAKMSGQAVFPAADSASPTPSPAVEATSPSPSPTPE